MSALYGCTVYPIIAREHGYPYRGYRQDFGYTAKLYPVKEFKLRYDNWTPILHPGSSVHESTTMRSPEE